MLRRTFLMAPLAVLSAQPERGAKPRLAVEWITGSIPEAFASEAVVFARAYTTSPQREHAEWALEHGRLPHVPRTGALSIWDYFERASMETADVAVMVAAAGDKVREDDAGLRERGSNVAGTNEAGSEDARVKDPWRERFVHAPLAIRWRNQAGVTTAGAANPLRPRVTGVLVSQVDVLPMLLGAARIAAPEGLHGRDVLGAGADEAVYIEGGLGTRTEWRALVRGYDKLVWTFGADAREEITGLYNVADDPDETRDFHDKPDHRLLRDSMWALAEQWMGRLGDGRDVNGLRSRRPN